MSMFLVAQSVQLFATEHNPHKRKFWRRVALGDITHWMNNIEVVAMSSLLPFVASGMPSWWQVGCSSSCHHTHSAAEGADCSVTEKPLIGSPSFVRSGSHRGLVPASQEGLNFVGISRMLVSGWVWSKGGTGGNWWAVRREACFCSSLSLGLHLQQPPGSVAPTPPVSGSESRFCRQPLLLPCTAGHWALVKPPFPLLLA